MSEPGLNIYRVTYRIRRYGWIGSVESGDNPWQYYEAFAAIADTGDDEKALYAFLQKGLDPSAEIIQTHQITRRLNGSWTTVGLRISAKEARAKQN